MEKVVGSFAVDRNKTDLHIIDIVNIIHNLKEKNLLPTFAVNDKDLDKYNIVLDQESIMVNKMNSMENTINELLEGQKLIQNN